MFKFSLLLLVVINFINQNLAISSYIYLPDKYVQEEIAIGSLIVDIAEEIKKYTDLNKQQSQSQNTFQNLDTFLDSGENLHYTFLNDIKSSTENTYFLLDSITGRATSKRYLDRESMCMNKHCMDTCELGNQNNFKIISNKPDLQKNEELLTPNSNKNPPGNCKLNLKVLIIPSYSIVSLNVILQDINDNKPQFRVDFMNQSLPENVPIGFKIPIDFAYDPDIGINSIQSYSLVQQEESTFKLTQEESQLALVVQQKLDREKVSQYNLTIIACDGGGAQTNCGQMKIFLNLIDINDHNPVFYQEAYSFSVFENEVKGAFVGQIKAHDLDTGLNGKVKYKLIGMSNSANNANQPKMMSSYNEYFELDEDTGMLSLNSPFDYENEQVFSLNVEARDCGVGSLPAYATIEIKVKDTNDNPPEISVSFLNRFHRNYTTEDTTKSHNAGNVSLLNLYLNENTEANTFIAHVSIFDRDSLVNGQLDWNVYVNEKLVSSEQQKTPQNDLLSLTKLNANSFTISTGQKSNILFDREYMASINVSIQSFDHGKVSNMAYYNFSIILLDMNDNSPKFEKSYYNDLSIPENNQLNQFVYKFNAIDVDVNENAKVTFSLDLGLSSPDEAYVYIEPTTGVLRASKVFDREKKSLYEFFVIANDNCEQVELRKTSRVKCILRIKDLNDNTPEILYDSTMLPYREHSNRTSLILRLDENLPVHTQLVKFQCKDLDMGDNGKTNFLLLNSNFNINNGPMSNFNYLTDLLLPFKLTQDGTLQVDKSLDREQQDFYDLVVVCYDSSKSEQNRLNTTLNLIIRLSDVNDNCPRYLNTSELLNVKQTPKSKFFNKDLKSEENIFTAHYTDDDATGKNSDLKFNLESHADKFELNIIEQLNNAMSSKFHSNQIYTLKIDLKSNQSKSALKLGKYLIRVRIADNGNPSCIKRDKFTLYVADNQIKTQQELIQNLEASFKQQPNSALDFINDEDEITDDYLSTTTPESFNNKKLSLSSMDSSFKEGLLVSITSFLRLKKSDYFIVFSVLIGMAVVFLLVSVIGFFFLCRKCSKKRSTLSKKKAMDTLKVKNYRELELMNSSNSNSNISSGNNSGTVETDRDEDNQNEINNLLDSENSTHSTSTSSSHILSNNRLSTSFKGNDQSLPNSNVIIGVNDSSIVSNLIMYPRETSTTVSSMCNSSNSSQISPACLLNVNNPRFTQPKQSISYMQQNFNNYSNTLKPKMCNDYTSVLDANARNRTLSSTRNQRQCGNSNNNSQRQNHLLESNNNNKYLTSFPQSLNTFNPTLATKRNYQTSTAVTPSSLDGSDIILVASSTSPTQSSCSSDTDYYQQQQQQKHQQYRQNQLFHQQKNNLIINEKNNQFNQSFYQNDRIIAKFSNVRQYVDVTSDEQEIEDQDLEEKVPCLYLTNSSGLGNSSLKKVVRNNFLRSSAV